MHGNPKSNVSIYSDGTAQRTTVLVNDQAMTGVEKVEIEPIVAGGVIRATITVICPSLGNLPTDL